MSCRTGDGPRRHRCSYYHAELVDSYHRARHDQWLRAEQASHGYDTELAAYFHPHDGVERPITFKDWLRQFAADWRAAGYWADAA